MTAHRDSPEPVHKDEINDKFKPATSIYPCPSRGEECEIEHSISEFADFIYCENCRTKFTRDRDTFVKHDYASDGKTIIKKSRQDKEDYVRFKFYRCNTEVLIETIGFMKKQWWVKTDSSHVSRRD